MPFTAKGYFERGIKRFKAGEYRGANEDFDEAIRRTSTFAEAYYQRALLKKTQQDFKGSVVDCEQALFLKQGNYQEASQLALESRLALSSELLNRQKNEAQQRSQKNVTMLEKVFTSFNEALKQGKTSFTFPWETPRTFFPTQKHQVYKILLLPDGRLACTSGDSIRLIDLTGKRAWEKIEDRSGSIALLPNNYLASASSDSTIKIWEINSKRCMTTLTGHQGSVGALAVLPDGFLASGSQDKTIKIWSINDSRCITTLVGHTEAVTKLSVLQNGMLASGSFDCNIRIWDVTTRQCVAVLSGHTGYITKLITFPDGRLVSASDDSTIKFWDVETKTCTATINKHTKSVCDIITFQDKFLVSAGKDNALSFYDIATGLVAASITFSKEADGVHSIVETPDGRVICQVGMSTFASVHFGLLPLFTPEQSSNLLKALQENSTLTEIKDWPDWFAWKNLATQAEVYLERNRKSAQQELLRRKQEEENRKRQKEEAEERLRQDKQKLQVPAPKLPEPSQVPLAFNIIKYDQIQFIGESLGEGGFGVVKKARWHSADVAVKQLKASKLTPAALEEFIAEANCHAALIHPNIVTLYGVCLEEQRYCIVMELMVNASLFEVLHNGKDLAWKDRFSIAKDIAVGLTYLHSKKIIHRDLKSLNVLLDSNMRAKLSDFGLSKVKSETNSTSTMAKSVGTISWMAPELFKLKPDYGPASDIYALGIVLWELASRKVPYAGADVMVIKTCVAEGDREEIPSATPPQLAKLIQLCWQQDAKARPRAQTIAEELMTNIGNAHTVSKANELPSSGYQMFSKN